MKTFNESLEFGKKLIAENLTESLSFFKSLNKSFPNNEEILFELGKICYILKDYNNAKVYFESIEKEKRTYHLYLLLAKTYKSLNNNYPSLKILLYLYKKYNKEAEIEKEIINLFLNIKKEDLAIKFLLKNNKSNKDLEIIISNYVNYIINKVANNEFGLVKNYIFKLISLFEKYTDKNEYLKIKNILLNEYEIGNKKIVLQSKPRILTVVLTNKCNLKCRMCDVYKKDYVIKDSIIQQIINLLPYLETVGWLGGEVFLYKDFINLLDIASKYNIKQSITTNGLLLTEQIIKKLCTYNLDLTISIDSIKKDIYENIRQGAKFETLLQNLELLKKYKKPNINLYINIVISKWNQDDNFYEFIDFAKKYNVSKLTYNVDYNEEENDLLLSKFNKFRDKILEAGLKDNIDIVITVPKFTSKEANKNSQSTKDKDFCLRPWKSFVIDIDGRIRSDCYCKFIYKITEKDNILSIWNGKEMIASRKNLLQYGKKNCVISCKNNDLNFQRFQI